MERMAEASPRLKARIAGVFYLLTFVTGISALIFADGRLAANLLAGVCYLAVTVLFYDLFKPVNESLSLLAAITGLMGCVMGALGSLHLSPIQINPLVLFG